MLYLTNNVMHLDGSLVAFIIDQLDLLNLPKLSIKNLIKIPSSYKTRTPMLTIHLKSIKLNAILIALQTIQTTQLDTHTYL